MLAADTQPRLFQNDGGPWSDAAGHPDARTDDAVVADDGAAAKDRGVGVNDDAVFDRRVPLSAADELAVGVGGERQRPERDALVDLDPLTDFAGLADHHAGAVVDEEVSTDGGPGMDVDTGLLV